MLCTLLLLLERDTIFSELPLTLDVGIVPLAFRIYCYTFFIVFVLLLLPL